MADNPPQTFPMQTMPVPVSAAPTQGASQFAIAVSPPEFLLAVGHSRVVMINEVGKPATPQAFQEWFLTLALSPNSAVSLCESLKAGIAIYEQQYGKIAVDPAFKVQTEQAKS